MQEDVFWISSGLTFIVHIFQVISRRRQCPQQDSFHSYRISSALSTIPVTIRSGLNPVGYNNTTNLCEFQKITIISDVYLFFSVTKLVGDLENSLAENFDSKEKIEALENVIQDFLLLRKLSAKLQSNQASLLENGRQK